MLSEYYFYARASFINSSFTSRLWGVRVAMRKRWENKSCRRKAEENYFLCSYEVVEGKLKKITFYVRTRTLDKNFDKKKIIFHQTSCIKRCFNEMKIFIYIKSIFHKIMRFSYFFRHLNFISISKRNNFLHLKKSHFFHHHKNAQSHQ